MNATILQPVDHILTASEAVIPLWSRFWKVAERVHHGAIH